jgi:hypothetical protein
MISYLKVMLRNCIPAQADSGPKYSSSYKRQKFPSIKKAEIVDLIKRYRSLSDRFQNVVVKKLEKNLFVIMNEG